MENEKENINMIEESNAEDIHNNIDKNTIEKNSSTDENTIHQNTENNEIAQGASIDVENCQNVVSQQIIGQKKWYKKLWFKICAVVVCAAIAVGAVSIGLYAVNNSKRGEGVSGFLYATSNGDIGIKFGEKDFAVLSSTQTMAPVAVDEKCEYLLVAIMNDDKDEMTLNIQNLSKIGKEPMREIAEIHDGDGSDDGNGVPVFRGNKLFYGIGNSIYSVEYKDEKSQPEKVLSNVSEDLEISEDGRYAVASTTKEKLIFADLKKDEQQTLLNDARIITANFEEKFVIANTENGIFKCDFEGNSERISDKDANVEQINDDGSFLFSVTKNHSAKIKDLIDDDMLEADKKPFAITKDNIEGTVWTYSEPEYDEFGFYLGTNNYRYEIEKVDGNKAIIIDGDPEDDDNKYEAEIDNAGNMKYTGKADDGTSVYVTINIMNGEMEPYANVKYSLQGYNGADSIQKNFFLYYSKAREDRKSREIFRLCFDDEIKYTDKDLYYYDGSKANKIDSNVKKILDSEDGIVVYTKLNEKEKMKMSNLESYSEYTISDELTQNSGEMVIYDKGNAVTELPEETKNAENTRIIDGDIFFESNEEDGPLYALRKSKQYKECEVVAEQCAYYTADSKDKVYYAVKNVDSENEYTLFFNGEKIAENIGLSGMEKYDSGVFFYQNYNSEKGCGDLCRFDGKNVETIATDVDSYVFDKKGKEVYVITDWEDEQGGTLKKWSGGNKLEEIAQDVIEVEAFTDSDIINLV